MKNNKNKLLACVTLMVLSCLFLVSNVSATDDDTNGAPTPDTSSASDNPMLIATQDNATTTSDDDSTLYETRDNSTIATTDPPTAITNNESDEGLLISTQATPDYTGYLVVGIALVVIIAVSSFVIVYRKRRK